MHGGRRGSGSVGVVGVLLDRVPGRRPFDTGLSLKRGQGWFFGLPNGTYSFLVVVTAHLVRQYARNALHPC